MKQRFITSIFIVLATAAAILSKFLPLNIGEYIFDIFILLIVIVAGYEISVMLEKNNKKINKFMATMYGVFNFAALLFVVKNYQLVYYILAQFLSLIIYGVITLIVECFTHKEETFKEHLTVSFNTLIACVYPTFFFGLMLIINHIDVYSTKYFSLIFILLIFAITFLTDTFAYLVGSKLRGPKLCPKISPNKTISGAIGGLIGGIIGAMLVFALANLRLFSGILTMYSLTWWHFMLVGLVGSIVGQAGDIFESFLKRRAMIKDSGNLFPGHGGMLDRIDAMTFVTTLVFIVAFIIVI